MPAVEHAYAFEHVHARPIFATADAGSTGPSHIVEKFVNSTKPIRGVVTSCDVTMEGPDVHCAGAPRQAVCPQCYITWFGMVCPT